MALDEVDDVLHALPDAVADDQQQELAAPEVAGDVVHELRFVDPGRLFPHQFEGDIAFHLPGPRHLALQILVGPGREFLGVVQDLPDHFPSRLRIPPELELRQDQSTQRVDVEGVHVPCGGIKLAAHGHRIRIGRIDGRNRQRARMPEEQILEGGLVHTPADAGVPSGIRRSTSSSDWPAGSSRIKSPCVWSGMFVLGSGSTRMIVGGERVANARCPHPLDSPESRDRRPPSTGRGSRRTSRSVPATGAPR